MAAHDALGAAARSLTAGMAAAILGAPDPPPPGGAGRAPRFDGGGALRPGGGRFRPAAGPRAGQGVAPSLRVRRGPGGIGRRRGPFAGRGGAQNAFMVKRS